MNEKNLDLDYSGGDPGKDHLSCFKGMWLTEAFTDIASLVKTGNSIKYSFNGNSFHWAG